MAASVETQAGAGTGAAFRAVAPGFDRYLSVRGAWDAQWSPDGQRLVFISDVTGVPEVWDIPARGGAARQRTFMRDRVMSVGAVPGSDDLIVGCDVGGNEQQQFRRLRPGVSALDHLTDLPGVLHQFGGISPDGRYLAYASTERDPRFYDVYVLDLSTGERRRLTEQDGSWYARGWAPDGQRLLVYRANRSLDGDLFSVPAGGGPGELRHLTAHEGFAEYEQPQFSPDGSRIWSLSDEGREYTALGWIDAESGGFTPVVSPDWDVEALALPKDGGVLAYAVNEDGYSQLRLRDVATGREAGVDGLPRGVVSFLKWSPDGETLALTLTTPRANLEIWLVGRDGSGARQLTHSPDGGLAAAEMVEPEIVRYPTPDGLSVPALFYRPAGPGPFPCVVHVHGGPEGQVRPVWQPVFQYLLSRGYAIFAPNVRGSTGYGKTYCHLDDRERRMDSVADLQAGCAWLAASGVVDPARLAVMGASYGGFMTLAAVTEYPELWAAAVDIVGIANFQTFFERTGAWRRQHRASEYGDPVADAELLRRISPIHKVDRIQAPMIVLHGRNDPRVPVEEAELIVGNLEARGRTVEYLCFEDEGHGFVKLANRIVAYTRIAEFLDRHLLA